MVCLKVCVCFHQRLHEQPGVESQRFLSAQRRHHLLQPVTHRLHRFQIASSSSWRDFSSAGSPVAANEERTEVHIKPTNAWMSADLFLINYWLSVNYTQAFCIVTNKCVNVVYFGCLIEQLYESGA